MHSTDKPQNDAPMANWDHCPEGELQRLVGRLNVLERCAKRRRFCYGTAGVLSLAVMLIISFSTQMSNPTSYGGLTCQQCQSHLDAYHHHLMGEVDEQVAMRGENEGDVMNSTLAEKMKAHLANCDRCRSRFNRTHPDNQIALMTAPPEPWATANGISQARMLFTMANAIE